MKRRLLLCLVCAALLCGGCAHNLKDLPGATTQPTEAATPRPTEGAALDADTVAMMQQAAVAYAREAAGARGYAVEGVDVSARATYDGVYLVTVRGAAGQYAYILRVDGDLGCEVLAEGADLGVEDMGRF